VAFEEAFDDAAHAGAGGFLFLPVDGFVFAEDIGEFLGEGNEFVVGIEVFDRFGLGQGIVEGEFVGGEAELFAFVMGGFDVAGHAEQLLDDFFIGEHAFEIVANDAVHAVGEFLGLDKIGALVGGDLFGDELFEQFEGDVALFEFGKLV